MSNYNKEEKHSVPGSFTTIEKSITRYLGVLILLAFLTYLLTKILPPVTDWARSRIYGYDYYEKMLRVALGEKVDFTPVHKVGVPNASHLLMSDTTGTITAINNSNESDERIIEIGFDYGVGDHVRQFHVGPDRIGHVITVGKTLEEAQAVLKQAMERITIEVEGE